MKDNGQIKTGIDIRPKNYAVMSLDVRGKRSTIPIIFIVIKENICRNVKH